MAAILFMAMKIAAVAGLFIIYAIGAAAPLLVSKDHESCRGADDE